jgi:hypothetical protein
MGAQNSVPTAHALAEFLAQAPQSQDALALQALRQYAGLA